MVTANNMDELKKRIQELEDQVNRLRNALYFYANPTAWPNAVLRDQGEIAKEALEEMR